MNNYAAAKADLDGFELAIRWRKLMPLSNAKPPRWTPGPRTIPPPEPPPGMTAEEFAQTNQPAPVNLPLAVPPGVAMLDKPECSEPDAQGARTVTYHFTILPAPG